MVTHGLARRLTKLEAAITDPTGERQQRIAKGFCPDCGCEHEYLPTNGGIWRCIVCGNRFTLKPGPACQQACPREGSHGCNALQRPMRLGAHTGHTPEQVAWSAERRAQRALTDLCDSIAPDHAIILCAWLQEHGTPGESLRKPGESWYELVDRLMPPALVRAFLLLIAHHVGTRLSVSLAPSVAQVYLSNVDAWPADRCDGCGTLFPARARLQPDDTYHHLSPLFLGSCPVCGLTHSRPLGGSR